MSNKPKGKNDHAWDSLFDKYDILNQIDLHEKFVISANQIKEFREPRLMAKFDHRINLPQIFAENRLAILPISRGDYVISGFEAYKDFEDGGDEIHHMCLPDYIESLDRNHIQSETISINCALASGMLADFLGEEKLAATVSGRMGSDKFDFNIKNSRSGGLAQIKVINSQIEIDAAYEGRDSLALLEAKRDISEDFLIRQLYYPYRVWSERINKKIRPVFLVYSNGVFCFYEYEFKEPKIYNSLQLVQQKNYTLEDTGICLSDLEEILQNAAIVGEPEIPFPQADNFKRIINVCELLYNNSMDRDEVTQEYAFDIRQTNYYTDACRYLGVAEKVKEGTKVVYKLTLKGQKLMGMSRRQRQLEFCNCILEHKVFHTVFRISLAAGNAPKKAVIVRSMKECELYKVESDETFKRRASTISSWINWMYQIVNQQ